MTNNLPSQREALTLLKKSGCSPEVILHCRAVMMLATKIAKACKKKGLDVDVNLVQVGALLHDIGRAKTHSIDHVIVGIELAERLGLPDSVVAIIQSHAGGGISQEEAEQLKWPSGHYLPNTLEEKIVSYADKVIEGSQRVEIERTINKLSRELGDTHPAIQRVKKLHDELSALVDDLDNLTP